MGFNGIFPDKPSSYGGSPMTMETSKYLSLVVLKEFTLCAGFVVKWVETIVQ